MTEPFIWLNDFQPTSVYHPPRVEMAFDRSTAKIIGERDNWTCVESGRKWANQWLVDVSHYNHDKEDPIYNTPENGRVLCLSEHLKEHIAIFQADPTNQNSFAMRILAKRAFDGLRTRRHYMTHPTDRVYDQEEVMRIIRSRDLDPDQLLR